MNVFFLATKKCIINNSFTKDDQSSESLGQFKVFKKASRKN